jgi:hypothetical protein
MSCPKCGSEGRLFSNLPGGGFRDVSVELKEEIASLREKIAALEKERPSIDYEHFQKISKENQIFLRDKQLREVELHDLNRHVKILENEKAEVVSRTKTQAILSINGNHSLVADAMFCAEIEEAVAKRISKAVLANRGRLLAIVESVCCSEGEFELFEKIAAAIREGRE